MWRAEKGVLDGSGRLIVRGSERPGKVVRRTFIILGSELVSGWRFCGCDSAMVVCRMGR